MEDEFFADILLVYIEGEITESYNYDDIIFYFKKLKKKKKSRSLASVACNDQVSALIYFSFFISFCS
jgi:hypothetical protein